MRTVLGQSALDRVGPTTQAARKTGDNAAGGARFAEALLLLGLTGKSEAATSAADRTGVRAQSKAGTTDDEIASGPAPHARPAHEIRPSSERALDSPSIDQAPRAADTGALPDAVPSVTRLAEAYAPLLATGSTPALGQAGELKPAGSGRIPARSFVLSEPRHEEALQPAADAAPAIRVTHQETHHSAFGARLVPRQLELHGERDAASGRLASRTPEGRGGEHMARAAALASPSMVMPRTEARPAQVDVQSTQALPVGSVGTQVSNAIVVELYKSDTDGRGPLHASPLSDGIAHASLRILKLQLAPESLGVVHVVLAKSDAALSVHLEVEATETAELLEADRDQLAGRVSASGYEVTELVIKGAIGASDASPPPAREGTEPTPSRHGEPDGASVAARDRREAERRKAQARMVAPSEATEGVTHAARGEAPSASHSSDRFLGARILRSI